MLRKTLTLLPPRRRPFSSSSSSSSKTLTQLQRSSFESSLHSSLTSHDSDQAWKLFRSFAAASSLPDKPLLNSLITHLSSSLHGGGDTPLKHRLKRAFVSAAYVIEKDPTFLEFDTLLALLQSMKLSKAASPALALVECMFKNRFFVPFDLWGGLVVDICRENGTLSSFLKVFKESCRLSTDEKLGYMKPDLAACNAALEACCLQMESLTDAESVIESMSAIGVKPDESTFGFLAYLYARKGLKEKISELESLMDGSKRVLYSNLISGYVKIADLDSVFDVVLQSLKGGDCSFCEETYCEIVKGFIESKRVKSLATLIIEAHKLESLSTESDKSVGFGIVNACIDLGFSGKSILDEMDAQGGSGGIGVYVPILKAYCKENRTAEATQLVTEISSTGVDGLEGQEELCFINANGTWYRKEPNFQYQNNYQQRPYYNNQQGSYQANQFHQIQGSSSQAQTPDSSVDSMFKQLLEFQARNEKSMIYEFKNIHAKIDENYSDLNNKYMQLASHLKALESQVAFMHSSSKQPMGSLPGKLEKNPKESCNVVFSTTYPEIELSDHEKEEDEIERLVVGTEFGEVERFVVATAEAQIVKNAARKVEATNLQRAEHKAEKQDSLKKHVVIYLLTRICNPGTETTEVGDLKEGLPERLFATDRFPSERVNMYSAVDLLLAVRGTLNGMPEMGEHDSEGGGDAEYPLYVHSEIDTAKKRKGKGKGVCGNRERSVLKQRRKHYAIDIYKSLVVPLYLC
ncbi:hypothetical protein F2Q70_00015705 [Brassica cretica]|uniref:At1g68980-like TPR repeats domain-containing protein n=1 Tax=Brassica cretica TaxID=69181 RepID=A0A8S9HUF2_BRACR|nr:hypothetical protein F2Q70_00015705 [Brassica cretica]